MSMAVDAGPGVPRAVRRDRRRGRGARTPTSVDRDARFPRETIDALRAERALSAFVPRRAGRRRRLVRGDRRGAASSSAAAAARARWCSRCTRSRWSTLVRHLDDARRGSRTTCASSRPTSGSIASVTSEVGHRRRHGALDRRGRRRPTTASARFEKQAPDGELRRPRRRLPDHAPPRRRTPSPATRSLALTRRDQTTLEQTGTWDPLGMRGHLLARLHGPRRVPGRAGAADAVLARSPPESMVPVSHILWSHLWLGIATDAFDRARAFVRAAAKRRPGAAPPLRTRLSHLMTRPGAAARRGGLGAARRSARPRDDRTASD